MTRDSFKYWALFLFVIFAPAIIPSGCEECGDPVVLCSVDDDCPPTEYCDTVVCTPRCESQTVDDDDGTEGAGCQFDRHCNSEVCNNEGALASCTCVGDGAGGSGGSAGSGGSGGAGGFAGSGGSGGSGNECGRDSTCDSQDINACRPICLDVCGSSENLNVHACFTEGDEDVCYCMCHNGPCIGG